MSASKVIELAEKRLEYEASLELLAAVQGGVQNVLSPEFFENISNIGLLKKLPQNTSLIVLSEMYERKEDFCSPKTIHEVLDEFELKESTAINLAIILKAREELSKGENEKCRDYLEEAKSNIDASHTTVPYVLARLYQTSANLHHALGDNASFLTEALAFQRFAQEQHVREHLSWATKLVIACVEDPYSHNFTDVLNAWTVQKLESNHWARKLAKAYESGTVKEIHCALNALPSDIKKQIDVEGARRKAIIVALIAYLHSVRAVSKNISFDSIAEVCEISKDRVEFLLMHAFADRVCTGVINQPENSVQILWIKPRGIDNILLSRQKVEVDSWITKLEALNTDMDRINCAADPLLVSLKTKF